ncbi:ERD (early-responsive to dehydration stress)family protein [Striga asiatica]|uniref:ERD (Early-responsive to dehydration stress)family protein n=1 Tax=Striga asiatica TaxID=4170 RepID=A0A5A7PU59_STRAF|nr:ERD (early-responsive to dehydration stress)family protein [Striga asiatica]
MAYIGVVFLGVSLGVFISLVSGFELSTSSRVTETGLDAISGGDKNELFATEANASRPDEFTSFAVDYGYLTTVTIKGDKKESETEKKTKVVQNWEHLSAAEAFAGLWGPYSFVVGHQMMITPDYFFKTREINTFAAVRELTSLAARVTGLDPAQAFELAVDVIAEVALLEDTEDEVASPCLNVRLSETVREPPEQMAAAVVVEPQVETEKYKSMLITFKRLG